MFDSFIKNVSEELQKPLPGETVQYLMAPQFSEKASFYLKNNSSPKVGCVMLLLYPNENNNPSIVLTLRQENMGVHSKQISFPGGKIDITDSSKIAAALRETEEEVGINPEQIKILGELSELYIPVSNFLVHPIVGYSTEKPNFILHEKEVAEIIEVPIFNFLDDKNKSTKKLSTSYSQQITAPYYDISGHHVWGATAMIISEFVEIVKQIKVE